MSNYKYPKPTVGQTVWLRPMGNNPSSIKKCEVSKVGIEYFYVQILRNTYRFKLDNWVDGYVEYSAWWKAYESLQQIEDEKEFEQLRSGIVASFRMYNAKFSLDQLRRIKQILDEQ